MACLKSETCRVLGTLSKEERMALACLVYSQASLNAIKPWAFMWVWY